MTARAEAIAHKSAGVLAGQLRALLRPAAAQGPRALAGLTLIATGLVTATALPVGEASTSLSEYVEARWGDRAGREHRVGLLVGAGPERLAELARRAVAVCEQRLPEARAGAVGTELGSVQLVDLVRASAIEARLLADDCGVGLDRAGSALSLRSCAQLLGERFGGQSIELRVPPVTAVQLRVPPVTAVQLRAPGGGPVHHRGTPPNVVETDPDTFWGLCTGALDWSQAREGHRMRVSGVHATEVEQMLPVLHPFPAQ